MRALFDATGFVAASSWMSEPTAAAWRAKSACMAKAVAQQQDGQTGGCDEKALEFDDEAAPPPWGREKIGPKTALCRDRGRAAMAEAAALQMAFEGMSLADRPGLGLPNLDLSAQQLFFIAFAQRHCVSRSLDGTDSDLTNSVWGEEQFLNARSHAVLHAMGVVNGAVANTVQFSEAFGCSAGDLLDLPRKCPFWH